MTKPRKKTKNNQVGLRLKFFRERNGLTQAELAEESSLDVTTIARIENGTRNPDKETLYLIAYGLALSVKDTAYLFGINIYEIEFKKLRQER